MRGRAWFAATWLITGMAFAQPKANDARERFQQGLAEVQAGNLAAAIAAFEDAYAIKPHYSVLYNIGQAQLTLGRPIPALAAFERYLVDGGAKVSETRRAEVNALIATCRKRLGALSIVSTAPDRERIWLDGVELTRAELEQPLVVPLGRHTIVHSAGFGAPSVQEVDVTSGAVTEVRLSAPAGPPPAPGQLGISCAVPSMQVLIDGNVAAETPLARPLLVAAGEHSVSIARAGYRSVEQKIALEPSAFFSIACDERTAEPLAPSISAALRVRTTPQDAVVLVNGRRSAGGALPSGVHQLRVERSDFIAYQRTISLEPGKSVSYDIVLDPTPEKRARDRRERSRQTTLAYALGGTGGALLIAGGSMLLWNGQRYDDWKARAVASDPDLNSVASIQRVDDLALGFTLIGAGLLAGGTWLFLNREPAPE